MDDFQFVAITELGCCPTVARNEVTVEFDGNTVGLHAEVRKKSREAGNCGEFAVFAVDSEFHCSRHKKDSILLCVTGCISRYLTQLETAYRRVHAPTFLS